MCILSGQLYAKTSQKSAVEVKWRRKLRTEQGTIFSKIRSSRLYTNPKLCMDGNGKVWLDEPYQCIMERDT